MAPGTSSSSDDDENDNDICIVKVTPTISLRILEDLSSSPDNSDADDDVHDDELATEDDRGKTDYNVDDKVEDSVGRFIWPTAVPLLRHIIHASDDNQTTISSRLIVELGAGCGVLGMGLLAASRQEQEQRHQDEVDASINRESHVILTDHDSEWLERNVALNATSLLQDDDVTNSSRLDVARLDWRKQQDIKSMRNRIQTKLSTMGTSNTELWIVGSDILYNHDSHQSLASTIYQISQFTMNDGDHHRCRIIIGFPDRNNDEANFLPIARSVFGDDDKFPSSKPLNMINYNNENSSGIRRKKKSMDLRIIDYFVVN